MMMSEKERKENLDLTVATYGRPKKINKYNIENAIGKKISGYTILCTHEHVSYKGFAMDNKVKHHPLKSDLKQFIKNEVYPYPTLNSTHKRLKK